MNAQLHVLFMNVPVRKHVAQQKHSLILLIKGDSDQSHSKSQAIWWTGIGNGGNKDQIVPFPRSVSTSSTCQPLFLATIHLQMSTQSRQPLRFWYCLFLNLQSPPPASLQPRNQNEYLQATSGSWLPMRWTMRREWLVEDCDTPRTSPTSLPIFFYISVPFLSVFPWLCFP